VFFEIPFCHALAYVITANGVSLYILLCSASCISSSANRLSTFKRKTPFATTLFIKGGGLIFEGGPIFEITVYVVIKDSGLRQVQENYFCMCTIMRV